METSQSNKDEYEKRAQACGDMRRKGTVKDEQRCESYSFNNKIRSKKKMKR